MLPELEILWRLLVVFIMVCGICAFFAMVFQVHLFKRYRLQKNEAALRKARLYQERQKVKNYKNDLLGAVKESVGTEED